MRAVLLKTLGYSNDLWALNLEAFSFNSSFLCYFFSGIFIPWFYLIASIFSIVVKESYFLVIFALVYLNLKVSGVAGVAGTTGALEFFLAAISALNLAALANNAAFLFTC